MFGIISILIIFLSLAGLIIIFSRQPVKEQKGKEIKEKTKWSIKPQLFKKIFNKERWLKFRQLFFNLLEKFIHRLRVISLRLDNFFSRFLDHLKTQKEQEKTEEKVAWKILQEDKTGEAIKIEEDAVYLEREYLTAYLKGEADLEQLKNLVRFYLAYQDLSSARKHLLEAYRQNPEDKIIEALFLEIWEKEGLNNKIEDRSG